MKQKQPLCARRVPLRPLRYLFLWLAIAAQALYAADNPLVTDLQEFGGIRTFLRAPHVTEIEKLDADIAVLGVPYDQGTSMRPGTRYGPKEIREQSLNYSWAREGGFFYIDGETEVLKGRTWADLGDVNVSPYSAADTSARTTLAVHRIRKRGAFPVVLGGDHSIAFPVIRAYMDLPRLTVVQFDAHLDSYGSSDPKRLTHGEWLPQVMALPFVERVIQIGPRGLANAKGGLEASKRLGAAVITTEALRRHGVEWALQQIPQSEHLYITLDIDAMDPALAPGTGTVELGGIRFDEMSALLRGLPSRGQVVGMDLVEVNPLFDPTGVTAQTAVRLILDLVGAALDNAPEGPAE